MTTAEPVNAAERPCRDIRSSDIPALKMMSALELEKRGRAQVVRMQIRVRYPAWSPMAELAQRAKDKTLWGIQNGDPIETDILYVFSGPGRLAGTTLLIKDVAGDLVDDGMWVYLRSFNHFQRLQQSDRRFRVPGTSLTYEDARGYIAIEHYYFVNGPANGLGTMIIACPRDAILARNLGYSALHVQVDVIKQLVQTIHYFDLAGASLKTYKLLNERRIGELWFPAQSQIVVRSSGQTTEIRYEHWPLPNPPAPELFLSDNKTRNFLERLRLELEEAGLGDRITRELAAAEKLVREYDEQVLNGSKSPDRK
jgi:hypothetical protein